MFYSKPFSKDLPQPYEVYVIMGGLVVLFKNNAAIPDSFNTDSYGSLSASVQLPDLAARSILLRNSVIDTGPSRDYVSIKFEAVRSCILGLLMVGGGVRAAGLLLGAPASIPKRYLISAIIAFIDKSNSTTLYEASNQGDSFPQQKHFRK